VASGQIIGLLVTLALTPMQLHRMGGERYGLLTVFAAIGGVLSFVDYGTSWAAFYFVPRLVRSGIAPEATLRTLGRFALFLAGAVGVVWIVAALATVGQFRVASMSASSLFVCAILAGLVAVTSIVSNVRVSVVRSFGYFRHTSTAAAMNVALINIVWAAAAGRSWDVHAVLGIQVLANLTLAIVWSALTRRIVAKSKLEEGSEPTTREIAAFAMTGSASAAGQSLLLGGDKVSLAAVGGLSGLPAYSIPFAMASRINLVGASLSTVLFPRMGGDHSDGSRQSDDVLARWSAAATIAVSGALSTALLIVGPRFFRLWLGGTLGDQAAGPVQALAIGFFFYTVGQIGYAVNDANGGIRKTALAFLVAGVIAPLGIAIVTAADGISAGAYASSTFIGLVGIGGMYLGRRSLPTTPLLWSLLGVAGAVTTYLSLGAVPYLPAIAVELVSAGVAVAIGAVSLAHYRRAEQVIGR
jgi:O-antigen/teichoic acid export membrane protein